MSDPDRVGEGKVSGNQASIPAHIRGALDIKDGDTLRWRLEDGDLAVSVVSSETGTFDDFEPGSSNEPVDGVDDHDGFGLDRCQQPSSIRPSSTRPTIDGPSAMSPA